MSARSVRKGYTHWKQEKVRPLSLNEGADGGIYGLYKHNCEPIEFALRPALKKVKTWGKFMSLEILIISKPTNML